MVFVSLLWVIPDAGYAGCWILDFEEEV